MAVPAARRWMVPAILLGMIVSIALVTRPAGADPGQAPTTCDFDSSSGRLTVRAEGGLDFTVGIERRGNEIAVFDRRSGSRRLSCGGTPTVHNVDTIVADATAAQRYSDLSLDLSGGRLGPGRTSEGSAAASEIEIRFAFNEPTNGDTGAGLQLTGSDARDWFVIGTRGGRAGVNLNADEETGAEDVDVRLSHPAFPTAGAPIIAAVTGDGNDSISAIGGPGFNGPLGSRQGELIATSGDGADSLIGGRGADVLRGGGGTDSYSAGAGKDEIEARDGRVESVDCGADRDSARLDAGEEPTAVSCERLD